jgi:hypothetical protein
MTRLPLLLVPLVGCLAPDAEKQPPADDMAVDGDESCPSVTTAIDADDAVLGLTAAERAALAHRSGIPVTWPDGTTTELEWSFELAGDVMLVTYDDANCEFAGEDDDHLGASGYVDVATADGRLAARVPGSLVGSADQDYSVFADAEPATCADCADLVAADPGHYDGWSLLDNGFRGYVFVGWTHETLLGTEMGSEVLARW